MTQPQQSTGIGGLLTRRIGPAPVWLYFVVFVLGAVIFLRWRASKGSAAPAANNSNLLSTPLPSQNFTTGQSAQLPWSSDVFVNVQQPGAAGQPGPPGPPGSSNTTPPSGPPAGQLGQYVVVGQPIKAASGMVETAGNTFSAIARQIWGFASYEGSLRYDPQNAHLNGSNLKPGDRVWVSAIPGPNPPAGTGGPVMPPPPARRQSITYAVQGRAEPSTLNAMAGRFGYYPGNGSQSVMPATQMVIPS